MTFLRTNVNKDDLGHSFAMLYTIILQSDNSQPDTFNPVIMHE